MNTWDDGHTHSGYDSMALGKDGGFWCEKCETWISSRWCGWGYWQEILGKMFWIELVRKN